MITHEMVEAYLAHLQRMNNTLLVTAGLLIVWVVAFGFVLLRDWLNRRKG